MQRLYYSGSSGERVHSYADKAVSYVIRLRCSIIPLETAHIE